MMQRITFFTLVCLFFSAQSHAWVITKDFEDGNVGTIAVNNKSGLKDGFDDTAGSSLYSTQHVYEGSQSASTTIQAGEHGFGTFGGRFDFPDLGVGDEIWWRVALFFPTDFQFDSGGNLGKGMRIHTTKDNGSLNAGYIDIYFRDNLYNVNNAGDMHYVFNEASGVDFAANNPERTALNSSGFSRKEVGSPIVKGQWVVFEQYVKFTADPDAGIYRVWQDGELVFQDMETYILQTPTSIADFTYLFTYWNATSPKENTVWVDDVVITNERPNNTDSFGNPFIGVVGDVSFTAPPNPPGLLD